MTGYNPEFFNQKPSEKLTTATLNILHENGFDDLAEKMESELGMGSDQNLSFDSISQQGGSHGNIV